MIGNEVWKLIDGLKYPYYISNFGRVKSVTGRGFGQRKRFRDPFIKKQSLDKRGYLFVKLPDKDGRYHNYYIHRLVASAFIQNPENLPVVNHLDFNPQNNSAENLEWTTNYGNFKYSEQRGRYKRTKSWIENLRKSVISSQGKPAVGISKISGNIIQLDSIKSASLFGFSPSGVCRCCKGEQKTHHGYVWRYSYDK